MKTKKQNYKVIDQPNDKQAAKNAEQWRAARQIAIKAVTAMTVGIALGYLSAIFVGSL
jgi:F0F1-type ATP synthase assembly protein I|tara:strand:- start:257 stop:430 length:174 start_codon:yes stop_codon:yes gene_type:complete